MAELPGLPVAKQDSQLADHLIPISTTSSPMFDNVFRRQIQYFAQGIVICEAGLVFGDLPKLAIEPLNNVSCIYDFPNLRRICVKRGQDIPIILPAFHAGGVLFAPSFFECREI